MYLLETGAKLSLELLLQKWQRLWPKLCRCCHNSLHLALYQEDFPLNAGTWLQGFDPIQTQEHQWGHALMMGDGQKKSHRYNAQTGWMSDGPKFKSRVRGLLSNSLTNLKCGKIWDNYESAQNCQSISGPFLLERGKVITLYSNWVGVAEFSFYQVLQNDNVWDNKSMHTS